MLYDVIAIGYTCDLAAKEYGVKGNRKRGWRSGDDSQLGSTLQD